MSAHIIIVGGGITGLSAAWYVQQQAADIQITLLEQSDHWGGKLITRRMMTPQGAVIVEGGPESFITRKPEVWNLAHELGLQNQLIAAPSEASRMRVLDAGRPLAVPLNPITFLTTPLLSARGKARMLLEPFIPARRDPGDESLAAFVDRRLGREARERFIGPILAGIYNTNPETQSILTTSPVMRELERHGSLVRGSLVRMREHRRQQTGQRPPQFISFASGTQLLADTLVQRLKAKRYSQALVVALEAGPQLILADGRHLEGDAVIVATPANQAASMFSGSAPELAGKLACIRHHNIGTISLLYRSEQLAQVEHFKGLMIPRREGRAIDAISCLWPEGSKRVPNGFVLLKIFFGGSQPDMLDYDDSALCTLVLHELAELLGVDSAPQAWQIFRWPGQFPQADVGHLERVAQIQAALPEGVMLAGASYAGIGVADCIRQGREAAQQAVSYCRQLASSVGV